MTRLPGVRLQSAALPYRTDPDGRVRVLLVSSAHAKKWTIPKGAAEPALSLAENAAKEAFEEAGVIGDVAAKSAGMYRAIKRTGMGEAVIEVWVFPLRVRDCLDEWPEQRMRRLKWAPCAEAARLLREPFLRKLCLDLADPAVDKSISVAESGADRHKKGHKRAKSAV